MADLTNSSTPSTLIALDIAKKHHDAKILYPNGHAVHLRINNTLEGYERLLEVADAPAEQVRVGFEPTADYHRNIAHWLLMQGVQCHLVSSLACARAREMLFKTWDKHDRKDASVILYLMEQGLSNPFYDPLVQNMMDIQEISNTYHQITLARTRCLNSLVNHYLTLYFPEVEQFLHTSRAEWFCQFLLKFRHLSRLRTCASPPLSNELGSSSGVSSSNSSFLSTFKNLLNDRLRFQLRLVVVQSIHSDCNYIAILTSLDSA